jgi:hypothetical protein
MKWIKSRNKFLNEAKIRDVIFPRQAKAVSSIWSEKYLDYEEVTPTTKIKQGKWKLSDEDKMAVLGKFFDCNMNEVYRVFTNLPDKLVEILALSIDDKLISQEKYRVILKDLNIKNPTIDQIVIIYDNVFRKLAITETQSAEMIQKDENGRPMRDESGDMIKVVKNPGDPIFSNNLVNINSFISDYNRCYPDSSVDNSIFQNREISNLRSMAKIDENSDYKVDFEIFNKDLYLSITHNPKDILNMSISKFYASCQHLYGGGYRTQLLGNIFDPNSIPAFLTFETPIFWDDEKISDQLPLSRMMIRNIESFGTDSSDETKLFFDRAYPDRMKDIFDTIVTKYSENEQNVRDSVTYMFTPDVDTTDSISEPYMDRLRIRKYPYIGKNTRTLYLNRSQDWTNVKIAPDAKIKELVIETTDIPEDLSKIPLNPDWIKFKFLTIHSLNNFDKVKTDSIAFDKCKFNSRIFDDISTINPNIKKLQIVSCDLEGPINISIFENLEELHMIYTLDNIDELKDLSENLKVKKLVLSGDLIKDKECKKYINSLKQKGMRVEIVGPII